MYTVRKSLSSTTASVMNLILLLELEVAPLQQLGTIAGKCGEEQSTAAQGGRELGRTQAGSFWFPHSPLAESALASVWISQSGSSLAGLLIGLLGERSSPGVFCVFVLSFFFLSQFSPYSVGVQL